MFSGSRRAGIVSRAGADSPAWIAAARDETPHRDAKAPHRVNGYLSSESVDERLVRRNAPPANEVPAVGRTRVLGYATVQEERDECSHLELQQQAVQIAAECERRGLQLLAVVREHERQHQRPLERPGLGYAFEQIAAGEASGIAVAELSRVTHSVSDLGRVLEWLAHREARFVVARPGLDTEEEAGRLALSTIIEVSRWERERLVERTRNGMRAARRKGPASVADHPELSERIAGMRAAGMTLQAIADQLNADGIPTVRGGAQWRPSSVQAAAGYHRPPGSYTLAPHRGWGE
jgi:DNA invertase Pin-like site-specific DNA recombinase